MTPRWRVQIATIVLASGSLIAWAAGSAGAATTAAAGHSATISHPGTTSVRPGGAKSGFVPGGVMQRSGGVMVKVSHVALARQNITRIIADEGFS